MQLQSTPCIPRDAAAFTEDEVLIDGLGGWDISRRPQIGWKRARLNLKYDLHHLNKLFPASHLTAGARQSNIRWFYRIETDATHISHWGFPHCFPCIEKHLPHEGAHAGKEEAEELPGEAGRVSCCWL